MSILQPLLTSTPISRLICCSLHQTSKTVHAAAIATLQWDIFARERRDNAETYTQCHLSSLEAIRSFASECDMLDKQVQSACAQLPAVIWGYLLYIKFGDELLFITIHCDVLTFSTSLVIC